MSLNNQSEELFVSMLADMMGYVGEAARRTIRK